MDNSNFKPKIAIAALFALSISACSNDEDFICEIEHNPEIENLQGIQRDIMMNIALSKATNVNQKGPMSRAINDVRLTPYIQDGDTILYVAQYSDGWEIYSGSRLTNMILFSSEHGVLDLNEDGFPESLKFLIDANANDIKSLPRETSPEQVHPTWGASSVTDEDLRNGHITVKVKSRATQRRTISYSDLPPGHWEWYSTEKLDETNDISQKLTNTEWTQDAPWNEYSKKLLFNNVLTSAKAGCVPVALGQYFYYTHFKDNCPLNTVTTATSLPDNKDFVFSGEDSTIWNVMPLKSGYFGNYGAAAMLIGNIGRKLDANYGLASTSVETYKIAPFLQSIYDISFPLNDFDYYYVKQSINAGYPVIAHAWSNIKNGATINGIIGHTFLVDRYKTTTRTMKYTYVYKRDPLPPGTEDRWESDDVDENGNVINWAYTNEFTNEVHEESISMNWG
ncbi:MAG: C10 family peptidase [Duncaniella sp.]|nr:C10 family peptidase [Duncaniella sp.]